MKQLWVFGDSFSSHTLMDDQWYQSRKLSDPTFKQRWWFDIICEELNLNLQLKGIGGNSSEQILFELMIHLPKIKKGDYVSIGLSHPTRTYLTIDTSIEYGIKENRCESEVTSLGLTKPHEEVLTKKDKTPKQVWDEFLLYFRGGSNNDEEVLKFYYMTIGESIREHFLNNDIKCVVWDSDVWSKHQNWIEYTNNEVIDGHWSPIGNKTFSEYLLNQFNG